MKKKKRWKYGENRREMMERERDGERKKQKETE